MKTIGILLGSLSGAGAEKSLLTLAETLAARGNRVVMLLLARVFDFTPSSNIHIHLLKSPDALASYTQAQHFDLFICSRIALYHLVRTPNIYGFVCITPSAWIDCPWWNLRKRHVLRTRLRAYTNKRLIAISRGIERDLVENIGAAPDMVQVIYNAYDFAQIAAMASEPGRFEDPYMLCVGALKKRKGQTTLLKAFAKIRNQHIKLLLIGKGKQEHRLRRLAVSLGLASRVVFIGWVANPYGYIKHARLCVLASTAEGLPRVVVEALALGTPVVATNCPSGPDELLTGELARFLVPVGEVAPMARAIDMALDGYPSIRADLRRFDCQYVAGQYERLAEKL